MLMYSEDMITTFHKLKDSPIQPAMTLRSESSAMKYEVEVL